MPKACAIAMSPQAGNSEDEDSSSSQDRSQSGRRKPDRPMVVVDDWLCITTDEGRPAQLAILRSRLNAAFAGKVCGRWFSLPAAVKRMHTS